MPQNKNFRLIVIAGILCLYVFARFWHLTDSCLWFDEIFSIHAAEHDWKNLFSFVAQDLIHPPLFYVLLKIWITIGGDNLFWLRLFPVLFSILAVIPFVLLCRKLKLSFSAVVVALLFLAANGALIKYAQEVRMYSLLQFFSLASMCVFVRFWRRGKNIWALAVINFLLIYTHYFGWFVIAAELAAVIFWQRERLKKFLSMPTVCFAGFVPWMYAVVQAARINADVGQNIGWMSKPDFQTLVQFIFDLIEPFYYQASSADFSPNYVLTIPLLIIVAVAAILFAVNLKNLVDTEKQNVRLIFVMLAAPVLIALVVSLIAPLSIWGTRHLIIVFAPAAILIGVFFEKIQNGALRMSLMTAVIFLFSVALIFEVRRPPQNYIWCAWENLAREIPVETPANIYVFEDLVAYHFWFAERRRENLKIFKIGNLPGVAEDKAYFLPRGFDAVQTMNFESISDDKFYIAFRSANWNSQFAPLKNFADRGYRIGAPKIYEAQGAKAFLVEVQR